MNLVRHHVPSVGLLVMTALCLTGCFGSRATPTSSTTPAVNNPGHSPADDVAWAFTEITSGLGAPILYRNGEEAGRNTILESLGGGVGLFDFDVDGHLDLVFSGGGRFVAQQDQLEGLPTQLLQARDDGTYMSVHDFAGIAPSKYYTHGVAIADLDNDGFPDVLMTGYGGLQLWHNHGDGTFREIAVAAGLTDDRWSSSAAWGDLNGDGNVDLYVAHYVNWSFANNPPCADRGNGRVDICPPRQFDGLDDIVYYSRGDGSFDDATKTAGLVSGGKGLGVITADFDQDGDVDVYVANDTVNNFHYWNDGRGHLTEEGVISGTAVDDRGVPNGSMGLALADFDSDQRLDLFVANYEDEVFALYRQVAPRQFLHASLATGIAALGVLNVGFGSAMVDVDLDGDPDVVVANGHIMHHPTSAPLRQKVMLLKNQQGQRLTRTAVTENGYLAEAHLGRGLATGDLDGDGQLDFVFTNSNEPAAALLNRTQGPGKSWLVRLIGRRSNRDAIGAIVKLTVDGKTQVQTIAGGGSYLSASAYPLMLTTATGNAVAARLEIHWPDGTQQVVPLAPRQTHVTVIEPE